MLERKIEINGINPAELLGVNNAKLKYIKGFFPKLKVVARGNVLTIAGDEEVMDEFERKFNLIIQHFNKYNNLTENNIDNLMLEDGSKMLNSERGGEILVHGNQGSKIKDQGSGGRFENALDFDDFEKKSPFSAYSSANEK